MWDYLVRISLTLFLNIVHICVNVCVCVALISSLIFTSMNELLLTKFLSKYCRRCHCLFMILYQLHKIEIFRFSFHSVEFFFSLCVWLICALCTKRDFSLPFGSIPTQNETDNAVRSYERVWTVNSLLLSLLKIIHMSIEYVMLL